MSADLDILDLWDDPRCAGLRLTRWMPRLERPSRVVVKERSAPAPILDDPFAADVIDDVGAPPDAGVIVPQRRTRSRAPTLFDYAREVERAAAAIAHAAKMVAELRVRALRRAGRRRR